MIPSLYMTYLMLCIIALLAYSATSNAHVGLLRPCARSSPRAGCPPPSNGQVIDYDLNAPIGAHSRIDRPLCRSTISSATRPVYKAGQSIKTEYTIGASHNGGHCQWALSYDNGKTWVVIKTMLRTCFRGVNGGGSYTVLIPIPKDAPSGKVVFMWLWNNASGQRELYSNCADIEIKGVNGGKVKGVVPLLANYGKSLLLPEFPTTAQDDSHEAFNRRKAITVIVPAKKAK
ncbi:hypothetical protein BGX28_008913 [Mortierella sp. GBA30]|nr:hypothetical protein BGX28_008913 [Mortierella sp. GBA30]